MRAAEPRGERRREPVEVEVEDRGGVAHGNLEEALRAHLRRTLVLELPVC